MITSFAHRYFLGTKAHQTSRWPSDKNYETERAIFQTISIFSGEFQKENEEN